MTLLTQEKLISSNYLGTRFMAKILIVDDSELQRAQIKAVLIGAGHEVIEAGDGSQGLEQLNKNSNVQLIICDVNMPVMDGMTMCIKVSETGKFPNLPIFMLTTETSVDLKERGKKAGVRAWIVKPFVNEKLLGAISKVTAQ